jgi:hypothetical protein
MMSTQPEPWNHHFVPRSLLRYFCRPEGSEYVYTFDKCTGKSFGNSIAKTGSKNGFNSYKEGGRTVNFELDFDAVDRLLASKLKEIHKVRNVAALSSAQRSDWADLVATQLVRTPIIRSTITSLGEQLNNEVEQKCGVPLGDVPTEDDARKAARTLFSEREKLKVLLAAKDMVLFEAADDRPFRISDRPVTIQSTLPFGDTGLGSPGVAIFMPLGQHLMLGMLCPSIRLKLNKLRLERLGLSDDAIARLVALRDGLSSGLVVRLDETEFERHNRMQIANYTRFVYGPSDNFEDVRALVAARPDTRTVLSSISMGEMGNGPGPAPSMPLGSWLVLFGSTEAHMLEVSDVKSGYPFEATVRSPAALANALQDRHFSEMRYYVDKHERAGMRDVQLVLLGAEKGLRVQVRHFNASLDSFMSNIDR